MAEQDFEKIIDSDTQREDEVLLPFMQDPRIGEAILFTCVPELGRTANLEAIISEVASEYGIDEALVKEAYERGLNKFERIQTYGN
jgi:hypothetical protein